MYLVNQQLFQRFIVYIYFSIFMKLYSETRALINIKLQEIISNITIYTVIASSEFLKCYFYV